MQDFLQTLLSAPPFMPHGHCYLWKPELVELHLVSDSLIAIAYYSIPIALVYFVRKRQDVPFNGLFLLFSAFIVACGTTHLMEVWTLWHPVYWLAGLLKLITAALSVTTAVTLVAVLPNVLALPGLATINQKLEAEIASRQQTEIALRESEERFRGTFEQAAVGIAHVSLSGQFLLLNQRFCNIVGYGQAELQTLTFQEITHPDDLASDLKQVNNLLDNKIQTYSLEKRYIHKDRSIVWINLTVSLVRDETGAPTYFIAVIEAISDRKWIELALRQSEATLKLFVKYAPAGIAMLDANLCYVFASQRWLEDYGLGTLESITGRSHYEIFPDIPERWRRIHQRCLAGAIERCEKDLLERADGSRQWIRWEVRPWYTANQSVGGILIFSEDITERKQAEAALSQLAAIVESSADAIISKTLEGVIVSWNAGAENLFGYTAAEAIGQPILLLIPNELKNEEGAILGKMQRGELVDHYETVRQHKDGSLIDVSLTVSPLKDATGAIVGASKIARDIRGRKQAEDERRQAEKLRLELQLLENILEIILAGYWDWNLVENQEYLSPTFKRMLGYEDHELPNTPNVWQQLIFTEDLPGVIECFDQHCNSQGQIPFYNEVRCHHKDGSTIWVICSGRVIEWDKNDRPLRMIGCYINITERKRAETQLQASEAELRALFAAMTDTVLVRDRTGRCLKIAPNSSSLFREPPEMLGKTLHEVFPSLEADLLLAKIHEVLEQKTTLAAEYCLLIHGKPVNFLANISPLANDTVIIVARDMTDRKQAEQELNRSRDLREAIFNESADALFLVDPQTLLTLDCNRRAVELFDAVDRAALIGIEGHTLQHYQFSDQELADITSEMQVNGFWSREIEYVTHQGNLFWGNIAAKPIVVAEQTIHLVRVTDISDRKQAEAQLRLSSERLSLANAELARASRLKDEFLAGMSHELRTPLNAVLGLSEALLEEVYGDLTPLQQDSLQTIEQSGQHLLALINDILDLSKIESGKMDLELSTIRVQSLCESSLTFFKQQVNAKQIKLTCQIADDLIELQADERRLRQALVNLLSNAVKFTPEHGIIQLQVRTNALQETVELSITDTGIGIAPEDMKRLFQPFVQLDSSLSRRYDGTGLGLALVRRIIDLHSGSVSLTSTIGQGSCFTIALPWQPSVPLTEPVTRAKVPAFTQPTLERALIVEDAETAAKQIVRYLADMGAQAIIHPQGEGAVEAAIQSLPNVIILDILLPDQTGWEVLSALKTDPATRTIPVIVISVVDERSRGLKLGAAAYLLKPITRQHLQQALSQVLPITQTAAQTALVLTARQPSVPPLILLAEDNEATITTINLYLQTHGLQVIVARNGLEAIHMAQQYQPALILMDVQMPELDGLEATRRIRSDPTLSQIPLIALTALVMSGDRERCLSAGANEYMTKPVSLKQLLHLIAAHVPALRIRE